MRQLVGRRRRKTLVFVLVLFLATTAGFLFRWETIDNPELGILKYSYILGRRAWLSIDVDRDGQIESKVRLDHWESAKELWEDRNGDGRFEIHARAEGGKTVAVSVDEDYDGVFDRTLVGESAESFWRDNPFHKDPHWEQYYRQLWSEATAE